MPINNRNRTIVWFSTVRVLFENWNSIFFSWRHPGPGRKNVFQNLFQSILGKVKKFGYQFFVIYELLTMISGCGPFWRPPVWVGFKRHQLIPLILQLRQNISKYFKMLQNSISSAFALAGQTSFWRIISSTCFMRVQASRRLKSQSCIVDLI